MIFTKAQKACYDKLIHKGGDHGVDGELWNRHDLHIIIHGLLGKRLTKRATDLGWTCINCQSTNLESDLECGYCDTPRPSR